MRGDPTIAEMEEACLSVRKGEMCFIEKLSTPYLKKKKGLLAFFKGEEDGRKPDILHLFAASEALLSIGRYREAIDPLQELISAITSHRVKDIALARVGLIAVSRGLPIDLGPILSELGLSRSDIDSAVSRFRYVRARKDPLSEMEKTLLQSLLLVRRTSWLESEKLQASHLRTAHTGFLKAFELSGNLSENVRNYHMARCLLEGSRFLLEAGDHAQGMEGLQKVLRISEEGDFRSLAAECLLSIGSWEEDEDEARECLMKAQSESMRLRNDIQIASSNSILGRRMCREGEREGLDRILHSAGIMVEATSPMDAAIEKGEAALWCSRLNESGRGIDLAREAYKVLKRGHDREELTRILCILFHNYMTADERTKAKKLLLDIVSNYPVKQFPDTYAILKEAVGEAKWLRDDRDTGELFEEEIVYRLSDQAASEIISRAKEAYPNEFGAMLRGIEHITHIEPIMEGSANRSSFMFSLFSRFSQREVPGEGVVHSHPSGSARPSRADISLFGRFPGINIIIAYPFEKDSMAAYDRLGNRVKLEIE